MIETKNHSLIHESLSFPCSYFSSPGKVRQTNEDACALPPPGADERRLGTLLALADGVGGVEGGAQASRQAVNVLQALFYASTGSQEIDERLRFCVDAVNAVNRLDVIPPVEGARKLTTLVAAVLRGAEVWIANVGDSRAYLVQATERRLVQLTEDHSGKARASKSAAMDVDWDADYAPGVITRAIGLSAVCQVDGYHYTWQPGDRLILCSDGLAAVPENELIDLVLARPVAAAAHALVDKAVALDGSDNATALVAAFEPQAVSDPVPAGRREPAPTVPRRSAQVTALLQTVSAADAQAPGSQTTPRPPVANPPASQRPGSRAKGVLLGVLLGWLTALLALLLWSWLAGGAIFG